MLRGLLVLATLLLVPSAPAARTWHITPDGTGDAPTIQAGIDSSAAGDVIELGCGTYLEHSIVLKSGIHIRSTAGSPDCVTIDAQRQGRVLYCEDIDASTIVAGITFARGSVGGSWPDGYGGAVHCATSSPSIIDCAFIDNWANVGAGL